jgi:hypothetical protein
MPWLCPCCLIPKQQRSIDTNVWRRLHPFGYQWLHVSLIGRRHCSSFHCSALGWAHFSCLWIPGWPWKGSRKSFPWCLLNYLGFLVFSPHDLMAQRRVGDCGRCRWSQGRVRNSFHDW